MAGETADVHAIVEGEAAATKSGVAHAAELVAFAEAVVGEDDAALASARQRLLTAIGPAGLVDAAAVAGNFERMVRIADATGIPLDAPVVALSLGIQDELALRAFGSAANTAVPGAAARTMARLLQPVARVALRAGGWLRGARR